MYHVTVQRLSVKIGLFCPFGLSYEGLYNLRWADPPRQLKQLPAIPRASWQELVLAETLYGDPGVRLSFWRWRGIGIITGFLMLFTPVGWLPTDREARALLA